MQFKNMKIEINDQQPLNEVVMELERLGYRKFAWSGFKKATLILTYENLGSFSDYEKLCLSTPEYEPTTLQQLKEMK